MPIGVLVLAWQTCRTITSMVFLDGAGALWLASKIFNSLLVYFPLLHSDSVELRQQCDMRLQCRLPADGRCSKQASHVCHTARTSDMRYLYQ